MKSALILGLAGVGGTAGGILWAALPAVSASLEHSAQERAAVEASVYYPGCDEVRLLGKAPLYAGEPGYRTDMDGDGDGIACEPRY